MSKLNTVRAMMLKAGREDTPIDEARTDALMAARMIAKYGFIIVDPNTTEETETAGVPFPDDDYEVPDFFNPNVFEDVDLFKHEVARHSMQCAKCQKEIRKGMTFARETQTKTPRVTHFECRSFFTNTKG